MPVLPLVGSTRVLSFVSSPRASAASIIESAMRSLMLPPGFWRSALLHTSTLRCAKRRRMRTCGVLPMVSRTLCAFMRGSAFLDVELQVHRLAIRCAHPHLALAADEREGRHAGGDPRVATDDAVVADDGAPS